MTVDDFKFLLEQDQDFKYLSSEINNTPVPNVLQLTPAVAVDFLILEEDLLNYPPELLIKYVNYYYFIKVLVLKIIEKTKSPTIYTGKSKTEYQIGGYIDLSWPTISFIPLNDPNNNWIDISFEGTDIAAFKQFFNNVSFKFMPCTLVNIIKNKPSGGVTLQEIDKSLIEKLL